MSPAATSRPPTTFFDFGDGQVKKNKKVDTTISSVLFALPLPAIAPHTQTSPTVLPQRNLLRQLTWGLPSGQAIAGAMKVPRLSTSDLSDIAGVYAPFATSTALWYYVLAEAKAATSGLTLGPVGGRIVTETLIGLLRADPTSYLSLFPRFEPFLGTDLRLGSTPNPNITGIRTYTRAHFLHYAGVVQPASTAENMPTGLLTPAHLGLLLIALLLIFGPKRLPETGRALGRGIREFKEAIIGASHDSADAELEPLSKPVARGSVASPASSSTAPNRSEPQALAVEDGSCLLDAADERRELCRANRVDCSHLVGHEPV